METGRGSLFCMAELVLLAESDAAKLNLARQMHFLKTYMPDTQCVKKRQTRNGALDPIWQTQAASFPFHIHHFRLIVDDIQAQLHRLANGGVYVVVGYAQRHTAQRFIDELVGAL